MDAFQEPFEQLHTIVDFWRWGTSLFESAQCFYGHGTCNAKDDAAALLTHALQLDPEQLVQFQHCRLTDTEKTHLLGLYRQRAQEHLPVPYITHETWFAGLSFYIDQRVLIPRSPLAEVLEQSFNPWINGDEVNSILDIGTGSGCIAIAAAFYCPHAMVDGIDVNKEAIAVAKMNIIRHGMEKRVRVFESDLFQNLDNRYDVIISNPPYVPEYSMSTLPKEYHHEPVNALKAGEQGLDIVVRILEQAHQYLEPGGLLIVEVGEAAPHLENRFPGVAFTWLEFERGGGGVFMLEYDQLIHYQNEFRDV